MDSYDPATLFWVDEQFEREERERRELERRREEERDERRKRLLRRFADDDDFRRDREEFEEFRREFGDYIDLRDGFRDRFRDFRDRFRRFRRELERDTEREFREFFDVREDVLDRGRFRDRVVLEYLELFRRRRERDDDLRERREEDIRERDDQLRDVFDFLGEEFFVDRREREEVEGVLEDYQRQRRLEEFGFDVREREDRRREVEDDLRDHLAKLDRDLATSLMTRKALRLSPPNPLLIPIQKALHHLTGKAIHSSQSSYLNLLRQWLLNCDQKHVESGCVPRNTIPLLRSLMSRFRPTRLLYVGGHDPSKLQLRETKSINKAKGASYVVLSHRWGSPTVEDKKRYCTTRENYKDRLNGFSINELPRTFRDAVEITRALRQEYLWIDALCIIQAVEGADSKDWKNEAGRMEETFGSAYCTIAADSALSWDHGFLPLASALPTMDAHQSEELTYTCNTNHEFEFDNDVNNSELNKRAWVLQERVLSHRILHFTVNYTYFACGKGVRCGNIVDRTMYDSSL